jgi:2-C-methyl-D-erythritol 4-phosphate cytidylyltransferase
VDGEGNITATLERGFLRAVQTPQIFRRDWYLRALENADNNAPDDCYIMENAGHKVHIVECSRYNLKVTDNEDLEFLKRLDCT